MAKKGFKLRLSLPSSLQFCRMKRLPSFPAATYRLSPFNPKAIDIAYPNVPQPPPSTPNFPIPRTHPPPAGIRPDDHESRPPSSSQYNSSQRKTKLPQEYNREEKLKARNVLYNSPVSEISDGEIRPVRLPKVEKQKKQEAKAGVRESTSSVDSGWFSTEGSEYEGESESLISSSMSFDSSYEFGYSLENLSERSIKEGRRRKKKKKKNNSKLQRLKRYASNSWKGGDQEITKTKTPEITSPASISSVFRRLMPCTAEEGKVAESVAVVKKSKDPYEDFKRSMLEMILEKHMFDAKDLEQLLQCFLSLNSRHHHEAIVRAFAEIWEVLFSDSPSSGQVSMGQ